MLDLVENFEIKKWEKNRHSNEVQRKQMVAIFILRSQGTRSGMQIILNEMWDDLMPCRMQFAQDFNEFALHLRDYSLKMIRDFLLLQISRVKQFFTVHHFINRLALPKPDFEAFKSCFS